MATVRLSDVQWDNDVYLSYMQEDRTAKNAFIASGAAVTNAQLQERAAGEGDYFGLPTVGQVSAGKRVTHSALPLRAYNLIYNEWFRDENLVPL